MRTLNRRSLPAQLDLRPALRRQEAEIAAATSEHKEQRPAPRRAAPSANKTTTARATQVKAHATRGRSSSPAGGKQDSAPIDTERSDQSPAPRGTTTTEGSASLRASTRTLEGDESAGGTGTGTGKGGGGPLQEDNPMSHVLREREERRRFVEEEDDECDLVRGLLVRPEWQAALWHPDSPTAGPEGSGRAAAAAAVARPPLRRVLSLGSLSPSSSPGGATAEAASFFSYRPTKVTLTPPPTNPLSTTSLRGTGHLLGGDLTLLSRACGGCWWLVQGDAIDVELARVIREMGTGDLTRLFLAGEGYCVVRVAQSGLECSPPFSPFRPLLPPLQTRGAAIASYVHAWSRLLQDSARHPAQLPAVPLPPPRAQMIVVVTAQRQLVAMCVCAVGRSKNRGGPVPVRDEEDPSRGAGRQSAHGYHHQLSPPKCSTHCPLEAPWVWWGWVWLTSSSLAVVQCAWAGAVPVL